mmetsp:Transcript_2897/g.8960  ORF Transcript_2897/g.8960 Transcript_2897/m.8960 type:complete len:483 (+) Transcript_2897:327-1775(+)
MVLHWIPRALISSYIATTFSGCLAKPFRSVVYVTVFTRWRWPSLSHVSCSSCQASSAWWLATSASIMQPSVIAVGCTFLEAMSCQRPQMRGTFRAWPNALIMDPYMGEERAMLCPLRRLLSSNRDSRSRCPVLRQASRMEVRRTSSMGSSTASTSLSTRGASDTWPGAVTILRRIEHVTALGTTPASTILSTRDQAPRRSCASTRAWSSPWYEACVAWTPALESSPRSWRASASLPAARKPFMSVLKVTASASPRCCAFTRYVFAASRSPHSTHASMSVFTSRVPGRPPTGGRRSNSEMAAVRLPERPRARISLVCAATCFRLGGAAAGGGSSAAVATLAAASSAKARKAAVSAGSARSKTSTTRSTSLATAQASSTALAKPLVSGVPAASMSSRSAARSPAYALASASQVRWDFCMESSLARRSSCAQASASLRFWASMTAASSIRGSMASVSLPRTFCASPSFTAASSSFGATAAKTALH